MTQRVSRKEKEAVIVISQEERVALYRTAQEQLDARILNASGSSLHSLVKKTFTTLDISTLCPVYIKALTRLTQETIILMDSTDVLKRLKARNILRQNPNIEVWISGTEFGERAELDNLGRLFVVEKRKESLVEMREKIVESNRQIKNKKKGREINDNVHRKPTSRL